MSARRSGGRAPKREAPIIRKDDELTDAQPTLKNVKKEPDGTPVLTNVKVEPEEALEVPELQPKVVELNDAEPVTSKEVDKPAETSLESSERQVPSQEVLELQQKVSKLQKDFEGACRLAREAQLRVDFLENLVDKKPTPFGNVDKKLVEELQEKIDDMTFKLAKSDGESSQWKEEWRQSNAARLTDRTRIDELIAKVAKSEGESSQLAQELMRANEDQKNNHARFEEFACKLTESERARAMLKEELTVAANMRSSDIMKIDDLKCKLTKSEAESARLIKELRFADEDRISDRTKMAECDRELAKLKEELTFVSKSRPGDSNPKVEELMSKLAKREAETVRLIEELRFADEDRISDRTKMAEFSTKLEELTKKEEYSMKNTVEKAHEILTLKLEIAGLKKLAVTTTKSEEMKIENTSSLSISSLTNQEGSSEEQNTDCGRCEDLMRYHDLDLYNLKREADSAVRAQQQLLVLEQSHAYEAQKRNAEIIEELSSKLVKYEGACMQQQYQRQPQSQDVLKQVFKLVTQQPLQIPSLPPISPAQQHPSSWIVPARSDARPATTAPANDPTNILAFLPLSSNTAESISYKSASDQLYSRFCKVVNDEEFSKVYEDSVRKEMRNCEVCGKTWKGEQIMAHFFSPQHTKTAFARHSTVSLVAFDYWMKKLEAIPKMTPPTATRDSVEE